MKHLVYDPLEIDREVREEVLLFYQTYQKHKIHSEIYVNQ